MCFLFSGTSIAIIFILTYFQGHLYKIFSDIQEVTQFCTTDFCSDPIRLLAESCVYATFEVWSVNQLDRREHSSYSRILKNRKLIQLNWKKNPMVCIYLTKLATLYRLLTWRPPFFLFLYFWADELVSSNSVSHSPSKSPPPFSWKSIGLAGPFYVR